MGRVDPRVEPRAVEVDEDGGDVVEVHQVVRDLGGNVVLDGKMRHVYVVEDGLIRSMEIRESPA